MARFSVESGEVKDKWSRLRFSLLENHDGRVKDHLYETGFLPLFDEIDGKGITVELIDSEIKAGKVSPDEIKKKILPLLLAVKKLHEDEEVIGDFNPDYVVSLPEGIYLKNLGGGALNFSKNDYSAIELYGYKPKAKPAADVYSISCYIYELITGIHLPNAGDREDDEEYEPLYSYGVDDRFEKALDKGLAVHAADRYDSIIPFIEDIYDEDDIIDFERDENLRLKAYKQAESSHEEETEQKKKREEEDEEELIIDDEDYDDDDWDEDDERFYQKKIFWVICVVALVIIGLGGYLAYTMFTKEEVPEVVTIKQTALEVSAPANYDNTQFEDVSLETPEPVVTGPAAEPATESAAELEPTSTPTPEPTKTPKPTKKPHKTKKPRKTQRPVRTSTPHIYTPPRHTEAPRRTPTPTRPPDYTI